MSNLIIVLGESGTGKSTSLRNLNPEETYVINVLGKPLPMRGSKALYNKDKKNYLHTDSHARTLECVRAINERAPHIKNLIIDDFSFLTNNLFMKRIKETGWDKYSDIGANTFDIFEACRFLRDDLYCFIFCHTEKDEAGMLVPKKIGTMVGKYVGIQERVSIVFHTQVVDMHYRFLTQHDGERMAKSPEGMFDELYIDNDLAYVREKIESYYNEVIEDDIPQ